MLAVALGDPLHRAAQRLGRDPGLVLERGERASSGVVSTPPKSEITARIGASGHAGRSTS